MDLQLLHPIFHIYDILALHQSNNHHLNSSKQTTSEQSLVPSVASPIILKLFEEPSECFTPLKGRYHHQEQFWSSRGLCYQHYYRPQHVASQIPHSQTVRRETNKSLSGCLAKHRNHLRDENRKPHIMFLAKALIGYMPRHLGGIGKQGQPMSTPMFRFRAQGTLYLGRFRKYRLTQQLYQFLKRVEVESSVLNLLTSNSHA